MSAAGGELIEFADVGRLVRNRLHSLNVRRAQLTNRKDLFDEGWGLEASSYKRLAELLFLRELYYSAQKAADWAASTDPLRHARDAYRGAHICTTTGSACSN